ncbi:MAG: TonB-dependent receptor [Lentimicrobium sp.]|nr:TonB-dependent receptor [Lentimicrobium sp.]HAH59577.1 TonB-dependent receptor [Bacteroidales bacterium]
MKKNIRTALIALFLFFTTLTFLYAQDGIVRGFVYEKETGEPVIFTNVYLYKTNFGAATDVNGYFTISRIPDGNYTLMVTYLGYDTLQEPIAIKGNTVITRKLYLTKAAFDLGEVQITADRSEARSETRTSVVKLTPKVISRIPTLGGQADLAQYLQVLPGVIFSGDQGGQLYIRGGSPVQNKVLLDGMIIYNPFHSIGLFSVFDTDILRNADIYTGGFGAEYGGRISSVMDLTTRDGNKKRVGGKFGASTFGAKLMLEGPLVKQKDDKGGSVSFLISAKNSYLKQTSDLLYNYIDTTGLPFNYTDFYGKISVNSANGSKVNFYGFNFNDKVDYTDLASYLWNSSGAGANWVVIPGNNPVLLEGNFAYSTYHSEMNEGDLPSRSSDINGFNLGLSFTYYLGKNEIKYGIEMLGFRTSFDFSNSIGRKISQQENTTELAGFVKYKLTQGKLLFEPGMRVQYYASLSNFSPEPRLALKYNFTDRFRMKMAMGLYSQNLMSANTDRDVVNLFYGFLSGPDNLQSEFDGNKVKHKLQKSEHIILGAEVDPFKNVTLNVEVYYKNFSQLTNINRYKIFEDETGSYSDKPEYLRKNYIIENGDASGFDVSFKFDDRKVYIWAVYSLAWVNRYDGQIEYVPHYDRRHNINLVSSYRFGNKQLWEFNARWNFGSGFPFTQTQGYYEKLTFGQGAGTDYLSDNGYLGIQYAALNQARLPYYHRLDLSLMRRFELGKHSILELNLSVTNIYNRDNIFYVNRITSAKVYQLPIMPSFGLTLSF